MITITRLCTNTAAAAAVELSPSRSCWPVWAECWTGPCGADTRPGLPQRGRRWWFGLLGGLGDCQWSLHRSISTGRGTIHRFKQIYIHVNMPWLSLIINCYFMHENHLNMLMLWYVCKTFPALEYTIFDISRLCWLYLDWTASGMYKRMIITSISELFCPIKS